MALIKNSFLIYLLYMHNVVHLLVTCTIHQMCILLVWYRILVQSKVGPPAELETIYPGYPIYQQCIPIDLKFGS